MGNCRHGGNRKVVREGGGLEGQEYDCQYCPPRKRSHEIKGYFHIWIGAIAWGQREELDV